MTSQKQPTPQEIKEFKEKARELSLENLKVENFMNLASAFLVQKSGGYGKDGESAVDKFKYTPSIGAGINLHDIKSGEEYDLFKRELLNSRQEGRMFSENISMHKIGQSCMNIIEEDLDYITIGDLYSLMSGKEVKKEFNKLKDVYLGDLKSPIKQAEYDELSEDKKEVIHKNQETYKALVGLYQNDLMDRAVSESLGERRKSNLKSLEKILTEGEGR